MERLFLFWILQKNYKHIIYLNYFENPDYTSVFAGFLEVDNIVMMLTALLGSDAKNLETEKPVPETLHKRMKQLVFAVCSSGRHAGRRIDIHGYKMNGCSAANSGIPH